LLLDKGADINALDANEFRPIRHIAGGQEGKQEVLALLLDRGADLSGESGQAALEQAVYWRWEGLPERLIEMGVDVTVGTALHTAVEKGNVDLVKLFLEKGAKLENRDWQDRTPLHRAADRGSASNEVSRQLAQILLAAGADLEARDEYGLTPLHVATSSHRDGGVAVFLIEQGADVNAVVKPDKDTAGSGVDTRLGRTPIFGAAGRGKTDVVTLLIAKGARADVKDAKGVTPLHEAARGYKTEEVIRLLVENGADVKAADENGSTPLHCAAESPNGKDIALLLIEMGADVDAKDKNGRTPLALAREKKRDNTAKVLEEHGAT
jgi:ankyrin repeat protein